MRDPAGSKGPELWVWLPSWSRPPFQDYQIQSQLGADSGGNGNHMEAAGWTASSGDFSFFLALPCVSSLIKMPLLGNLGALVKRYPDRRAATPIRREDVEGDTRTTSDSQEFFVLYSLADGRKSPVAGWSIDSPSEQGCLLPPPNSMALGTLF